MFMCGPIRTATATVLVGADDGGSEQERRALADPRQLLRDARRLGGARSGSGEGGAAGAAARLSGGFVAANVPEFFGPR